MTDRREQDDSDVIVRGDVAAPSGRRPRALERRKQGPAPGRRSPQQSDEVVAAPPTEAPPTSRRGGRRGLRGRNDAEFHPRTIAIDETPRSPIHGLVLITIAALLASAVAWAFLGRIPLYTSSPGKVQTTGRTKVLEGLATGKVIKVLHQDGDLVKAGEVLVELDPTEALAARTIVFDKLTDLRAETQRERVDIAAARAPTIDPGTKIAWDKDVPVAVRTREEGVSRADLGQLAAQIDTLLAQKADKEAVRDKFAKDIEAQKALVAVTQENLAMIDSLMKIGFNSQAKYLDMKAQLDGQQVQQTSYEGSLADAKQAILMIDSEMAKTREVFVTQRTQAISDNEQTIVDLAQQLIRADKTLDYMTLRAPVAGTLHASAVTTIGQVVKPGQQLMQIVPSDAPLEIEAYVLNSDVGFIRKGDPAVVKVDAFTYNVFGAIDATVTDIGHDALAIPGKPTVQSASLDGQYGSQSAADKTGNLQYPIHLHAKTSTILVEGKEVPLAPGMGVSVEIETERLRAVDYILTPIEELFSTAAHER